MQWPSYDVLHVFWPRRMSCASCQLPVHIRLIPGQTSNVGINPRQMNLLSSCRYSLLAGNGEVRLTFFNDFNSSIPGSLILEPINAFFVRIELTTYCWIIRYPHAVSVPPPLASFSSVGECGSSGNDNITNPGSEGKRMRKFMHGWTFGEVDLARLCSL